LLTGRTPLDAVSLINAGLDEVRRLIREKEPQKPSTALNQMALDTLSKVSGQRNSDPKRLLRATRGDLDWISMKALEKDRGRRYESAIGFARDIQRHLSYEAVNAGPPDILYRAGKFLRKYRRSVAEAAIILVLILNLAGSIARFFDRRTDLLNALAAERLADRRLAESRSSVPPPKGGRVSVAAEARGPLASAELALSLSGQADLPPDRSKLVALFQAAADRGSSPAALMLGECFLRGDGVTQDVTRGIALIKQAAEADYPQAIDALGVCYYRGEGVGQDYRKAYHLFSRAADLGHPQSLGNLAILYLNEEGAEYDPQRAFNLLVQGANAGNPHCMYLFARSLQFGIGVRRDEATAREWYDKAAQAGNVLAQNWIKQAKANPYFR
jgi:TPR repeat protein